MTTKLIKEFELPFKITKPLTVLFGDIRHLGLPQGKKTYRLGKKNIDFYNQPEFDKSLYEQIGCFESNILGDFYYKAEYIVIATNSVIILGEINLWLKKYKNDVGEIPKDVVSLINIFKTNYGYDFESLSVKNGLMVGDIGKWFSKIKGE